MKTAPQIWVHKAYPYIEKVENSDPWIFDYEDVESYNTIWQLIEKLEAAEQKMNLDELKQELDELKTLVHLSTSQWLKKRDLQNSIPNSVAVITSGLYWPIEDFEAWIKRLEILLFELQWPNEIQYKDIENLFEGKIQHWNHWAIETKNFILIDNKFPEKKKPIFGL